MDEDDLAELYRSEAAASIAREADTRLAEVINPEEEERYSSLSLVNLVKAGDSPDLVGALMVRLGEVRAALTGHGGALVVDWAEIVVVDESESVSLRLNLDGACIACGAAPGTLQGIQDDLLSDEEVSAVQFSTSMLDAFDELTREFLQFQENVTFT